jgi:hypothetical protein
LIGKFPHAAKRDLQIVLNPRSDRYKLLTRGSDLYRPRAAIEQLDPQDVFDVLDGTRHCGL